MKVKIVPTLLTHSFAEFKDKLKKVEKYFSLVQIDCMDNKFVKNKTFYEVNKVKSLKYKGDYELHLMVLDPGEEIKKWEKFNKVKKMIFHYEAAKNDDEIFNLIGYIKKRKFKVGLAINPETPVKKIEKFIPSLDLVFLLGVKPGWGGQILKPSILNKAKFLRKNYPRLDIEIDGGVNLKNIKQVALSGVNIISTGTLIFKSENIKQTINQIKGLIN